MPIANQAAADRASVASRARMQSNLAMSSGQAMMSGPAVAQKAAGVQAQEQGQIAAQAKRAEIQADVGQAQQELHATDLRMREQQANHEEQMATRHTEQRNKLRMLGRDVEQKLLEDTLKFDKTEREARFANQRQLSDFLKTQAHDEQVIANYQQSVKAALDKDLIMMRGAFRALEAAEQHQFSLDERERNKELQDKIRAYKEDLQRKLDEQKKKNDSWGNMMAAGKMVVGGALLATGVGGAAGATLLASGASDVLSSQGGTGGKVAGTLVQTGASIYAGS